MTHPAGPSLARPAAADRAAIPRQSTPGPAGAPPPLQASAGYVPGVIAGDLAWETLTFAAHGQTVHIRVPRLTPTQIGAVTAAVGEAQSRLSAVPVLDIVDAIDRTVARMLDITDPCRQEAERVLPVITGFDAEMVRLGLNAALKSFRRPQLLRFLAEDFGDPGLLDDFRPRPKGGWSRAFGPRLLAHVWAGNVPGLPLWSLVAGLLVKAGSVGKVASDEPWLAGWFARTLAEVEPRLADTVAVLWWPGADDASSQALCRHAEVLMVYGGDTAIAAWRRHAPASARFLAHGHKLSAGLIGASALDTRQAQAVARQAALDMVRWDQQGCYSPHAFYVERGGRIAPRAFADQLAGELAALQHPFPRRALSLEEAHAVAGWRRQHELLTLQDDAIAILGPAQAPWSVVYLDGPRPLPPGALNRTACVIAVDRLEDAVRCLAPRRAYLQTVALAAEPDALFRLAPLLGQVGVTRICALGAMATPEVGWHHDGRFSLLDLVRLTDIESSAEQAAEAFAPYRD